MAKSNHAGSQENLCKSMSLLAPMCPWLNIKPEKVIQLEKCIPILVMTVFSKATANFRRTKILLVSYFFDPLTKRASSTLLHNTLHHFFHSVLKQWYCPPLQKKSKYSGKGIIHKCSCQPTVDLIVSEKMLTSTNS
jgi:hypothetical protein